MASTHSSETTSAVTRTPGIGARMRARLTLWSQLLERAKREHPTV